MPARLNLLCARIGERALGSEKIENAADAFAITAGSDLRRLLRAGEKVIGGCNTLLRCLQRVVRDEYLRDDVLPRLIRECRNGVGAGLRCRNVVLVREPLKIGIDKPRLTLYEGPLAPLGEKVVRAALLPSVSDGSSADFATLICAPAAAACARAAARSGRLRSASLMTLSTLCEIIPTGIAPGIG